MANKIGRVPVREQDPQVRVTNFEEVCYGYSLEEAQLEASRCLHCRKPRCVDHCPVSVQIPQFIAELAAGDLAAAAAVIAQDSSLPSVCGRVCPQESQCEGACILGIKGEPVAIARWSVSSGIGRWNMPMRCKLRIEPLRTDTRWPLSAVARRGWPVHRTWPRWGIR